MSSSITVETVPPEATTDGTAAALPEIMSAPTANSEAEAPLVIRVGIDVLTGGEATAAVSSEVADIKETLFLASTDTLNFLL